MSEAISSLVLGSVLVAVVAGLDSIISRAQTGQGRSQLRTGLYAVFGLLGAFLFLYGIARLTVLGTGDDNSQVVGLTLIVLAGVTAVVLAPNTRELLASVIPFDPESYRDTIGLIILLWVTVARAAEYFLDTTIEQSVTYAGLLIQALILSGVALAAIGLFSSRRTWSEALVRLGVVRPPGSQVGIAVLLVGAIILSGTIANVILEAIDPSIFEELEETLGDITGDLDFFWGAVAIGLTAAVGEELLLRGAIQPRYGLVFTAIVFSVLHVQYNPALVFTSVLPAGIILGLERKYLNTTACIITHATYNGIAVLLS